MEGNQMNHGSVPPEIFKKTEEKKSKLPLISVVLSAITLFITIVILVIVIMSTFMSPMRGGMVLGGVPQNIEFQENGDGGPVRIMPGGSSN